MTRAGGSELTAVSSFEGTEPLRLPFDVQRSPWFAALIAASAAVAVAVGLSLEPVLGLAVLVAVGVGLAVALNRMVGLVLLAAVTPAASGLARGLPVPGFRLSEVVAGGVGVILLVAARRFARWTVLDWLALLYAVATLALGSWNLLRRGEPFVGEDVGLLLGPFQFLLLYRAVLVTADTPERRRLVVRLLLVFSVPVSLLAIGQQLNLPGARDLVVTLTGTDIYAEGQAAARATGPFPHWQNLAGYLFMVLLVAAAVLIRRVPGVLPLWALVTIAVIDGAALVETLTFAPILGLVAGCLILAVWLRGLTRVLIGLAVALLVSVLVFGPRLEARTAQQFERAPGEQRSALVPQTIQYRYDLWTGQILPALGGNWVTGYGPDLPPEIQSFPYTESLYIGLLYRGGVLLLAVWLALTAAMALAGQRAARHRDPLQQALGAGLAAAIVCLLFMHLIQGYFVASGVPQVLWLLLGLLAFRDVEPVGRGRARANGRLSRDHVPAVPAADRRVATAFSTLDPGTRALLDLSYRHGLSDTEIVGVLGLSAEAVERRRVAGLQRLGMRLRRSPADVERALRAE